MYQLFKFSLIVFDSTGIYCNMFIVCWFTLLVALSILTMGVWYRLHDSYVWCKWKACGWFDFYVWLCVVLYICFNRELTIVLSFSHISELFLMFSWYFSSISSGCMFVSRHVFATWVHCYYTIYTLLHYPQTTTTLVAPLRSAESPISPLIVVWYCSLSMVTFFGSWTFDCGGNVYCCVLLPIGGLLLFMLGVVT